MQVEVTEKGGSAIGLVTRLWCRMRSPFAWARFAATTEFLRASNFPLLSCRAERLILKTCALLSLEVATSKEVAAIGGVVCSCVVDLR